MPDPDSPANISSGTDCLPRGITETEGRKTWRKILSHSFTVSIPFLIPLNRDDTACNAESTASVLSGVPSI